MVLGIKNDEACDLIEANNEADLNLCSKLFEGIFLLAVGILCLWVIFINDIQPYRTEFFLWFIGGGLFTWLGLYQMLVFEFVIIDKKSRNIIIEKNYIIKILTFSKKISFSDLRKIEINKFVLGKWFKGFTWNVNLITFDGIRFVYHAYSLDDAWNVSYKIRENQEKINRKRLPIFAEYTRDDLDNIPDYTIGGY